MIYKAGEITQEIAIRETRIPNVSILEAVEGNGHLVSLEKPYFKELKQYLETMKKKPWLQTAPIVFISENSFIARQACAIWKRQLEGMKNHNQEEEDEDYDYDLCAVEKENKKEGVVDKNEIIVITRTSGEKATEETEAVSMVLKMTKRTKGAGYGGLANLLEQSEMMLIEIMDISNPDELAEDLLHLRIPQLVISVFPKGNYKYFVKRLSFEGDFQIINLGNPEIEDYVDYGKKFVKHFQYDMEDEKFFSEVIRNVVSYRGNLMKETDVYQHLRRGIKKAYMRGEKILRKEDLKTDYYGVEDPTAELDSMIGLEKAKNILYRYMAARKVMKGKNNYQHLIFAGFPGTGKSQMARIFASVMGKMGLSNGRFVDASRSDLIGKYVGHTAAQMKKIFEEADGGVLFIDEASFLLEDDRFVQEAVIELVRFMELYPQTTVIFATYPKEAEGLLQCDPGLASRIYQTILFENYNNEELWEIAKVMAKKYEFEIAEECRDIFEVYIDDLRKTENYGNARDVRKLLQAVMEEYGLNKKTDYILDEVCFQDAIQFLNCKTSKKNTFGFCI